MGTIVGICLACALIGIKLGIGMRFLSNEKSVRNIVLVALCGGGFAIFPIVLIPVFAAGAVFNLTSFVLGVLSGTLAGALGCVICDKAVELLTPTAPPDDEKKNEEPPDKK